MIHVSPTLESKNAVSDKGTTQAAFLPVGGRRKTATAEKRRFAEGDDE